MYPKVRSNLRCAYTFVVILSEAFTLLFNETDFRRGLLFTFDIIRLD